MADTVRDLATLLALAPDNTTGLISPQDLRDMLVSAFGCYAGLRREGGATNQAASSTAVVIAPWDGSHQVDDLSVNATTGIVTVATAGKYLVNYSVTFTGSSFSETPLVLQVQVLKEGSAVLGSKSGLLGVAAVTYNVSGSCIVDCAASDELALAWILGGSGTATMQMNHGQFVVTRLE